MECVAANDFDESPAHCHTDCLACDLPRRRRIVGVLMALDGSLLSPVSVRASSAFVGDNSR